MTLRGDVGCEMNEMKYVYKTTSGEKATLLS